MAEPKKTGRRTVPFTVPVKLTLGSGEEITKWLKADGELSEDEADAVEFRILASATPREQDQLLKAEHDYFGFDAYVDLYQGMETTRRALLAKLEQELWPDGRPAAQGEIWLEQEKQISEALAVDSSTLKVGFDTMTRMSDRISFYAKWEVLGVDHPPGWEAIVDREMDAIVFTSLWNAYCDALEELVRGKTAPSKS